PTIKIYPLSLHDALPISNDEISCLKVTCPRQKIVDTPDEPPNNHRFSVRPRTTRAEAIPACTFLVFMNRHAVPSPECPSGARRVHLRRPTLAVFAVCAAVATAAAPRPASADDVPGPGTPAEALARVLRALDAGDIPVADSLFAGIAGPPAAPAARHRYEIAAARLAASRGDWR